VLVCGAVDLGLISSAWVPNSRFMHDFDKQMGQILVDLLVKVVHEALN